MLGILWAKLNSRFGVPVSFSFAQSKNFAFFSTRFFCSTQHYPESRRSFFDRRRLFTTSR